MGLPFFAEHFFCFLLKGKWDLADMDFVRDFFFFAFFSLFALHVINLPTAGFLFFGTKKMGKLKG